MGAVSVVTVTVCVMPLSSRRGLKWRLRRRHYDRIILEEAEVGAAIDRHFVPAGRQANQAVAALVIDDDGTDSTGGGVGYRDLGAANGQALRVGNRPGQRGVLTCAAPPAAKVRTSTQKIIAHTPSLRRMLPPKWNR